MLEMDKYGETTFGENNHEDMGPTSSSSRILPSDTSQVGVASASILDESKSTPLLIPRTLNINTGFARTASKTSKFSSPSISDQALISAVYNTIAISVLVVCIGLCGLLFAVMQTFIRAILWAVLTSAFLFSLKKLLTDLTRQRLELIEQSGSTLAFELIVFPFRLLDSGVDWIWSLMQRHYRYFIALVFAVIVFNFGVFFSYRPIADTLLPASIHVLATFNQASNLLAYYADNMWMLTCTLVVAYVLALTFYWQERYTTLFQIMSLPVWSSVLFLSSSVMGSWRPLFFVTFGFLVLIGIYSFGFEYVNMLRRKLRPSNIHETTNIETTHVSVSNLVENSSEVVENVGAATLDDV